MPHSIRYDQQKNVIIAEMRDEIILKDLDGFLADVIKTVQCKNCYRIITDLSRAYLNLSFQQFYELPHHIEKVTAGLGMNIGHVKRAFIASQQQMKNLRFYETVSLNQGLTTKMCQCMEEAMRALNIHELN
jgi:hypothetical protein